MTDFNPYVAKTFWWQWTARFYAWRARRAGYKTHIRRIAGSSGSAWTLGGHWSVVLSSNT